VSRFWLNYRRRMRGRLLGVVILDSPSLVQARMSAAALRIDRGMPFADGRPLRKAVVELVPAAALGRMLDPQEARALQESLAAAVPDTTAISREQAEV
jgi:hypothetical protein